MARGAWSRALARHPAPAARVAVLRGEQLHTLSSDELRQMEESQAALIENVRNTLRAREELV